MDHSLSEHFDKLASKRDQFRQKGKYYHRELEKFLRFLVPKNQKIVEIGCATGDTLNALEPAEATGVDISQQMIKIGKEKYPEFDFIQTDGDEVDLNHSYDVGLIINTIGYFSDIQKELNNLHTYLEKDARLIIVYFSFLWKPILRFAEILGLRMPGREKHWLPDEDIQNLLELSGFDLVREERRFLIPFYIPLLSWICNTFLVHLPIFRSLALNTVFVARKKDEVYKNNPSVSVIIPCRNERGNIESAIQRLPQMGSHTEVIYVEGNSQDHTFEECKRVQKQYADHDIKVFKQKNKGKGDAVRLGFDKAIGDILMILDADLTVPPEDLPKFYEAIYTGTGEFINGSRLVYNMESEAMRPLNLMGNKFFSWAFSFLLSQRFRDTLCGTKVLWKKDYQKIIEGRSYFGDFDPFGDFDLLFGAAKLNLKIVEIPIRYRSREYGETQISRFRHGWLLLKMTFFAMKKIKFV